MRVLALGIATALVVFQALPARAIEPNSEMAGDEFFERKIRPLLAQHCYSCHARGEKKGGLSLESREGLLAGGESGTVAIPGKPDESLLIAAVSYTGDLEMPPNGKLAREEIEALKHWLAIGAPWPATVAGSGGSIRTPGTVSDADRQFWSFQPIRDHVPPQVKQTAWPRRSLDNFILAQLEAEGLEPVEEADPRTFIRRATFDLTGLPPTAEDVEQFVAACSATQSDLPAPLHDGKRASEREKSDPYAALIDRLLQSPRYGERWARHWLDVARYGEDQAHTFQARIYFNGYRYRDWIVSALNGDMPFDRFVTEQLAGDLLQDGDRDGRMAALGFVALGPVYYADNACVNKAKMDEYDDRLDTTCRGLLGLTVACARCHDHKFDPITMHDYYGLAGVFASSDYFEAPLVPAEVVKRYDDQQAQIKQNDQRLKDAQADEARKLGESFAPQTAEYLVAAWKVLNRRKIDSGYQLADAAKDAELHDFLLDRWLQFLTSDGPPKLPLFMPWRELLATQDAKSDLSADAEALAEAEWIASAVQATVVDAIGMRRALDDGFARQLAALKAGEKKPNRPALEKGVAELLKALVDDRNGPLALPKQQVDKMLPKERKEFLANLQRDFESLKKSAEPKYPFAHGLKEGTATNLKIHLRGSPKQLGDEAPRRFLAVLSPADSQPFTQGSGRLELARAIASRDNPLTARVFVNRVWQQHFGRGIVGTPSNFGLLGERPTHPELLDHLATKFIESGWSIKQLHREIMLSTTYRLASSRRARNFEHDPDNRLLWRMNRRRLDVESWRDAALAVSGNLDLTVGGPPFDLNDAKNRRRTLYASISRHDLNPMLRLFDFPDPNLTSERRVITTVPMQQLFILNSEFVIQQAKALAARLNQESLPDDQARIERIYRWVFARAPQPHERELTAHFLAERFAAGGAKENVKLTPWEQLSQILLGTNEFAFVD
jgi:hypothetical protein